MKAMSLVDTSVWVDHLRRGNRRLAQLLREGVVLCHPFVIGELACGNLARRRELLDLLAALPEAPVGTHTEVLAFVEQNRLVGRGLGWVDVHLLVSGRLGQSTLWSLDRRLSTTARALGLAMPAWDDGP